MLGRGRRTVLAVLVLVLALGVPPAASASPGAPAPPGTGCVGPNPARLTGTLLSGGVERRYEVHLPPGADPRRALPVLLAYHGKGGRPADMRALGIDAANALVLYPAGRRARGVSAWEGTLDFPLDGVDTRFALDLVAEAGRHVCIDRRRVYATGASQGGGMADVLACTAPGLLAGIAPVAGAFYRANAGGVRECRSGPLRVLEIHGDADPVIAYTGTQRSRPIPEWLAGWTARDRCPAAPVRRPLPPDVEELRWGPCVGGTEVRHFLVRGGNHGWPGGASPAIAGPGERTTTISATREMLAFFGLGAAR